MIIDSNTFLFLGVLFFSYLFIRSFIILFISPNCTKCDSTDIEPFSEITKYEIQDFHKCKKCGNIDFVNAGPRPEYYKNY